MTKNSIENIRYDININFSPQCGYLKGKNIFTGNRCVIVIFPMKMFLFTVFLVMYPSSNSGWYTRCWQRVWRLQKIWKNAGSNCKTKVLHCDTKISWYQKQVLIITKIYLKNMWTENAFNMGFIFFSVLYRYLNIDLQSFSAHVAVQLDCRRPKRRKNYFDEHIWFHCFKTVSFRQSWCFIKKYTRHVIGLKIHDFFLYDISCIHYSA